MKPLNCIGALLALSLASCATDSNHSTDATKKAAMEAEKAAAMDDYNGCIMEAARRFDDGTDASLVALAVEPDCKDQFSRYVKASGKGMDSSSFSKFSETLEYNQTELTAGIVQKMRSQQTRQN